MNLRGIVAGVTGAVNPQVQGMVSVSIKGATTNAAGRRTPAYAPAVQRTMQVQALSTEAVQHLDAMNITGSTHSIYINGQLQGLMRAENIGGDLILLQGGIYVGRTFLVKTVIEEWPDWTHVAVVLQDDT